MNVVSSASAARSPGVYGILVRPARVIRGISLGYLAYCAQFDAGQVKVGYLPQDGDDLVQTYEPRGTARKKSGWYGIIGQLGAPWFIVRVNGGSAGLAPPTNVIITQAGTPGAATVKYRITAVNAAGETVGSQEFTTTTANATLNGTNYNVLNWTGVTGALTYNVYRTSGGATQGKIATGLAVTTYNDQGAAGSGSLPTSNASGWTSSSLELIGTGGQLIAVCESPGLWGNSISWQIAAASNGDATKRDHTFTVTDPITGTTQETYRNVALNQSMASLLSKSRLLASLTFVGTMTVWPANGTYTLTNGSDGAAVTAADYQAALDQLALEENVTVVVTDDCGDSIRAAVNSNVVTHCANLYNRVCHITGSKSNDWTTTKTDKANYQSELSTYYGAWVQVLDDSGTNLVDVPLSIFSGVIRVNIPVHWSIANHDANATKYLGNIKGISTSVPYSVGSKAIRDEATDSQIVLPIQGVGPQPGTRGPWQLLHGRDANLTSGYQYECVTWYRIYLLRVLAPQLDAYTNGPNDLTSGLEIQTIVNAWLAGEASAGHLTQTYDTDGITLLPAFSTDILGVNSAATLANGEFYIQIDGHHPGVREKIFLLLNVGETVSVRAAAA